MKVSELFEAAIERNKKLGFSKTHNIPLGGTKEWLKAFNATETDVNQALRVVRQSPEYRAFKALGMEDVSTERHNKIGSIAFEGYIRKLTVARGEGRRRIKLTVQANGKIDETGTNDRARYPMASGKPRIVPGDAVASIAKSMTAALEKMTSILSKRIANANKETEAGLKAKIAERTKAYNARNAKASAAIAASRAKYGN